MRQQKPFQDNDGETYLYIAPFPHEAKRIRINLEAISAVRADGVEIPLAVRLAELGGAETNRQRLLASNPLPPGKYQGFSFRVKGAYLKGEQGDSALLLTKEASLMEFPFEVRKAKASLFSLAFKYDLSVVGEVRFSPVFSVAVPGRPLVNLTGYAINNGSNTITVFDKKSHQAVEVIQTGAGPAGIVLDQRQRRAYLAVSGEDAIEVIDVSLGAIVNRIRLRAGDAPRGLALSPDGTVLITANTGSNSVSLVDPVSLIETARINLPNRPGAVMVDRSGRKAYLFNALSNNISVLDIPNRVVSATIATDSIPLGGEFNRKGDKLIVFQQWSPHLLVIDPVSLSTLKKVYVGLGVGWIKVDPHTDNLYVGKRHDGTVEIFDPFSYIPGNFLATGAGTSYLAIDGEDNNLYLIHPAKSRMQIFNLVSGNVAGEIDLDDGPYRVTLMGER